MEYTSRVEPLDTGPPDALLIEQVLSGDTDAFRMLMRRYEPVVARTVKGMLGPGPDAEDVGQEVFIRLHRGLPSFRAESTLKTYLTRIAINLALNVLEQRRARRWRFVAGQDIETMPGVRGDQTIETSESVGLVRAAVQRLDPRHRSVVVLRMLNGCSTQETSDILNISYGTVLSRLSRAMKMLERSLKPYMDEL
jgi:RNA polymerase sigma-70 factor (ECF subfamily)